MSKIEWNMIIDGLQRFMKDRNLTTEMQKEGFIPNIIEELDEYARAKTDDEKIDALCDLCVFSLNTIENSQGEELIVPSHNPPLSIVDMILKVHTLANFVGDNSIVIRTVKEFYSQIVSMGYNPFDCMQQTIREIESRKGTWDDDKKKFIKSPGFYSKEDILSKYTPEEREFLSIQRIENKWFVTEIDTRTVYKYDVWYKAKYKDCKLN